MVVIRPSSLTTPKEHQVKRNIPPSKSRTPFLAVFVPLLLLITGLSWIIFSIIQNSGQEPASDSTTIPQAESDDSPRRRTSHHPDHSFKLPPFAGCVDPNNLPQEQRETSINLDGEGNDAEVPQALRFFNEGRGSDRALPVITEEEVEIVGPCANEGVWDIVREDEYGREQHIYVSLPNPQHNSFEFGINVSYRHPFR